MSIRAAIHHVSDYRYDRMVNLGPQIVRLRPAPHCRTRILDYALTVSPANHFINWQQDASGNWLARLVFPERTDHLTITVDLTADLSVVNPFDFFVDDRASRYPFTYDADTASDLTAYLVPEPVGPKVLAFIDALPKSAERTVDFLVELNSRVQRAVGLHDPHGGRRPDAGGDAGEGVGIVPRFGLAARPDPAPPWIWCPPSCRATSSR